MAEHQPHPPLNRSPDEAPTPASATAAPPLPPSLGVSGSSPTWAADSQHTWGGPSVLLAAGWDGPPIDIGRVAPPTPPVERDVASRFEQLVMLGKGGMGEVWRVRDVDLNRVVAMKIVRANGALSGPLFARFVAEAQATAQLEHPGIVPVYELGRLADGRIYYTMQEIRGRNLAAVLSDLHTDATPSAFGAPANGWTFNRVMEAFRQVADTISFAHARGVIHRDLKPANIMLGAFGEVRVVDWGLVKVLDRTGQSGQDPDLSGASPLSLSSGDSSGPATSAGAVAGTRGYMAPEQAAGQIDLLSPATDVYALGGILYAILAGRAPGEPDPSLSALDGLPRVPAALREICARAMAPAPSDRFSDASELASAISTWLERAAEAEQTRAQIERFEAAFLETGEAVQAEMREALLRLHGRDDRPVPRPVSDLAGPALDPLLRAGLVKVENNFVLIAEPALLRRWDRLAGWLDAERDSQSLRQGLHDQAAAWERHGRARDHLWKGEQLAELDAWLRQRGPRLSALERAFAEASVSHEAQIRHRRKLGTAGVIGLLAAALLLTLYQERQTREALHSAEAARASEAQALQLAEGRALGAEAALAMSQGRAHTALALGLAALARMPEDPHLGDMVRSRAISMDPLRIFAGHQGFVYHNEWVGPDRFISSGVDRTLRLWDARTGEQTRVMQSGGAPVTIAASPDGTRAAAVLESGGFELWDLERGERIASDPAHSGFGLWTEFSSDGRIALTTGTEPQIRLWDGHTGAPLRVILTEERTAGAAIFARQANRIAVGPNKPSVYDAESGERLFVTPDGYGLANVAISSSGALLATATAEGDLSLWEVSTGARLWTIPTETRALTPPMMAFSPDDQRIYLGYMDGAVHSHRADTGERTEGVMTGLGPVNRLELSADGQSLLTSSTDGHLGLWDARSLRRLAEFEDPSGGVAIARLSPDGHTALLASRDGQVRAWQPRILAATDATRCAGRVGRFVADSPNGAWLSFATDAGPCVRPVEADHPLVALMDRAGSAVALTRSGDRVAFSQGNSLTMVDAATGAELWSAELGQPMSAAAFSLAERALLVQLDDLRLRFFDAETGAVLADTERMELRFRLSALQDLATAPLLALPKLDGGLDLHDGETGRLVRALPPGFANPSSPASARALADGARVAVGDNVGHLRVFALDQEQPTLELKIGEAQILAVATARASDRIATVDGEGEISLVDPGAGKVLRRMSAEGGGVTRLQFSPDDRLLVSSGAGGALTLWDPETGAPIWRWKAPSGGASGCVLDSGGVLSWSEGGLAVWALDQQPEGALTNLRVCEGTTRVVAVTPFPSADSPWAPASACAAEG